MRASISFAGLSEQSIYSLISSLARTLWKSILGMDLQKNIRIIFAEMNAVLQYFLWIGDTDYDKQNGVEKASVELCGFSAYSAV